MRIRTRGYAAAAGAAALALAVAACGGSRRRRLDVRHVSGLADLWSARASTPGPGRPPKGGTLNMLGQGDVDFMDYNVSYYTIGALGQRPWLRLLYAYPATPGKVTTVAPDLATALPTISNGGKTYTVTIRTGAMWDTSPPRQVTAADALLGLKRSCNPTQPFGGLPDFEALIVGYQQFCDGFAKVSSTSVSAIKKYIDTHQVSGVKASGQTITYNLAHPASYFPDMLQLDAFAPAPVESLNYLPGSGPRGAAHHRRRAVQDPELRAHAEHRLRPQPGLEGQHGPGPQGLRQRDQGLGDRDRSPSSSSCRPTRPQRAWSSTRSRRSARTRAWRPR